MARRPIDKTIRDALCAALIAYPTTSWWQVILKTLLLRSCDKHQD